MQILQDLEPFVLILTNLDDTIVHEDGLETQLQYNLQKEMIGEGTHWR